MRGSFQTFKNIGPYRSQIVLKRMFYIVEGTFLVSLYEIYKTRQDKYFSGQFTLDLLIN